MLKEYYKALQDIRKNSSGDAYSTRLKSSGKSGGMILRTGSINSKLSLDWLEMIEHALPHFEAAIREDRQFIKQEGNTVPIEKVRRVQRASIEHLAKHSELITKVPEEGMDLIPEKLSVYENQNNYAIYENRFLYMVLLYTRDFVEERSKLIRDYMNVKKTSLSVEKQYRAGADSVDFSMNITIQKPNETTEEGELNEVSRVENVLAELYRFLSTGLMKEMVDAPLVQPPIVRTNVLKMDLHFREVAELFESLTKYEDGGMNVSQGTEEPLIVDEPTLKEMEADIAEVMMLSDYVATAYGTKKKAQLAEEYEKEKEELRELQLAAEEKKRKELRERIKESGAGAEDYLLALEAALEDSKAFGQQLEKEAKEQEREHLLYVKQKEEMLNRLESQIERLTEENRTHKAQIIALREINSSNGIDDKYVERDEFIELEKEYEAFRRFYKRNWKEAKKHIRGTVFGKNKR